MTLAEQLQAIVARPGWNQKRIADETGVDQPTISKWINGHTLPSRGNEQRLYEFLRSLGADTGPTALERLGGPRLRATDPTDLVRFAWSGHLTPAAAAKVASIIADDTADRAFHWQPTGASA